MAPLTLASPPGDAVIEALENTPGAFLGLLPGERQQTDRPCRRAGSLAALHYHYHYRSGSALR
ncbi:MAG: hypothetical protein ABEH58_01665 [Haloplanus sp.]